MNKKNAEDRLVVVLPVRFSKKIYAALMGEAWKENLFEAALVRLLVLEGLKNRGVIGEKPEAVAGDKVQGVGQDLVKYTIEPVV